MILTYTTLSSDDATDVEASEMEYRYLHGAVGGDRTGLLITGATIYISYHTGNPGINGGDNTIFGGARKHIDDWTLAA